MKKQDPWKEFDNKILSDRKIKSMKNRFDESTEFCKKAGYTNDEHQKKIKENSDKVASIRGGIINSMVDFEHFLCLFLSSYFCGETMKETEFYEKILSKDFFTTYQKIKLFERIAYHKQKKYKGKYNGLSGIMFKLNNLRNLVAHGTHFHFTKPELGFPYSGKATCFDNELAKRFKHGFDQAYFSLYLLNEDLHKEKFEKEYGVKMKLPKLSKKKMEELAEKVKERRREK